MSASPEVLRGSCLCGAVRFELTRPPRDMSQCHCLMCRRAHGSAYGTYLEADAAGHRIVAGAEHVVRYASSPEAERRFCGICGSRLSFHAHGVPARVWIAAGTLDDDPGLGVSHHIFVGSKAPWYRIADDLPQFAAYPEAGPDA
jgi:hypothetical protein